MAESIPAATGAAIRNGTSGKTITDPRNGTMAVGLRSGKIASGNETVKSIPATIKADTTDGSLLDLRPYRHDSRAGGRGRAMNGAAL